MDHGISENPALRISIRLASILLLTWMSMLAACFYDSQPDPREYETLTGHGSAIHSVAFSPEGDLLASSGENNSIKLWNTSFLPTLRKGMICENEETRYEECTPLNQIIIEEASQSPIVQPQSGEIFNILFTPDGKLLAAGSEEAGNGGVVFLFDVDSGELNDRLVGHRGPVKALAISPDGKLLAAGAGDLFVPGEIVLWNLEQKTEMISITGHASSITSLAFDSDGSRLASSGMDGVVRIWDGKSGDLLHTLIDEKQTQPVYSVAFHPMIDLLVAGGYHLGRGGAVQVWDIATEKKLFSLGGPSLSVRDIRLGLDGQVLVGASEDQMIYVWALGFPSVDIWIDAIEESDLFLIDTIKGHWGPVNSLSLSPGGAVLASGSDDSFVRLWAMADLTGDSCHNGIDDDADGWVDGKDPDCLNLDSEEGLTEFECNDGLDNDNDGYTDADDSLCSDGADKESVEETER